MTGPLGAQFLPWESGQWVGSSLRSETRGDVWLAPTLGLLSSEARKGAERLSPWELLSNLKGPEGEKEPTGPGGWELVGEMAASSPAQLLSASPTGTRFAQLPSVKGWDRQGGLDKGEDPGDAPHPHPSPGVSWAF